MPSRYFFELEDDVSVPDFEGLELPSLEVACTEALKTLAEMAREVRPGPRDRQLVCTVRDGKRPVYRLELTVRAVALA